MSSIDKIKNSIQQVSLATYTSELATEKENRSGWIDYGVRNDYPNFLIQLYNNAPVHNALVNSIAFMIAGKGTTNDIVNNAIQGVCFDLKLQGGFFSEVIWNINFTEVVKINHLPFENCRIAYNSDEDEITGIYYSNDWKKYREKKNKPVFIPKYNPETASGEPRQVVYGFTMSPSSMWYSRPDYSGGLNYIELATQIGIFHNSNIQNGLMPSMIINFMNGTPSIEERETIKDEWEDKMTGVQQAGKFIMTFNEDISKAPQIIPFPLTDADKQYQFLSEECTNQTIVAHRCTSPLLFGVRTGGTGFGSNKDEMVIAFEIFKNQVIKPFQQIVKDTFSFLGDFEFIQNDMFDSVDVVQQPVADIQPQATTTPTETPSATTSTTPTEKVSDVTYNGAQISSALEIVASVGLGTLTKEQAIVFLVQFLGLDVDVAQSMFETSGNAVAQLSAQKKKKNQEIDLAEIGERGGIKKSDKAPKSDTPNKNPKGEGSAGGDASGKRGAKVTEEQEKTLQKKADDFNEKESNTKNGRASLGALKSVFQRGLGAFNTSHSPKVTSAEQWAYARVNAFLYLLKNGRPENSKYDTDFDLLPKKHPKYVKNSMVEPTPEIEEYWLNKLELVGEVIDEDEWELISETDAGTPEEEEQYQLAFMSTQGELKSYAKPNAKSDEKDSGLYKIRYQYSQNLTWKNGELVTRKFCQQMVSLSKKGVIYKYEDIQDMSDDGVNSDFAPAGSNSYNLYIFKGGCYCRHNFKRLIFFRKRKDGKFLPNNGLKNDVRVNTKEANNLFPKGEESIRPNDMPNRGKLN